MAKIKVEIADNPTTLAKGLMHRQTLAEDTGMLFKFEAAMPVAFWGKDTYVPLDVAFIDKDNRIFEIKHIAPMSTKIVHSSGVCSLALEANAGYFKNNGINVGQSIKIIKSNEGTEIEF